MSTIGKPERATQDRVISLFRDALNYRYLGNRSERTDNSNIDEELLGGYLIQVGYTMAQIGRAIHQLRLEADMDRFMPKWQSHRQTLNRLPVRQESWGY